MTPELPTLTEERWIKSSPYEQAAAALIKTHAELSNPERTADNTYHGTRYATLAAVLDTVRPVLATHGLALLQFPSYSPDVKCVHVTTLAMHESGQFLGCVSTARVAKDDPQGVGSAITYLRRYAAAAVCGIHQADDDEQGDDGKKKKKSDAPPRNDAAEMLALRKQISAELDRLGIITEDARKTAVITAAGGKAPKTINELQFAVDALRGMVS